jgi:hypothetical protein
VRQRHTDTDTDTDTELIGRASRTGAGTYLPRFYGLHRWKPGTGRNVRFVVMNNVFATGLGLDKRFDLKVCLVPCLECII